MSFFFWAGQQTGVEELSRFPFPFGLPLTFSSTENGNGLRETHKTARLDRNIMAAMKKFRKTNKQTTKKEKKKD